eukprot:2014197-Amphidinium_carterae.2
MAGLSAATLARTSVPSWYQCRQNKTKTNERIFLGFSCQAHAPHCLAQIFAYNFNITLRGAGRWPPINALG